MKKIINKNEKGITLIALVITIIVLLLLAGVAISMLSGENGIINKTTEATYETEIGEIKEALGLKRTELLAINEGKVEDYTLTLDDLNISDELKNEYKDKLKINIDGKLCYDSTIVTNPEEQNKFKELGIEEFVENNTPQLYSFTLNEINSAIESKGAYKSWDIDGAITYQADVFWEVVGAEEDLRGRYGINPLNGSIMGKMSTNSGILKLYGEEQTEGNYCFLFMEHNDGKDLITISFGQMVSGSLREADFTTGGESMMLSKLGDIEIYFGEI